MQNKFFIGKCRFIIMLMVIICASLLFNPTQAKASDDVLVIKTAAQLNAIAKSVNEGK